MASEDAAGGLARKTSQCNETIHLNSGVDLSLSAALPRSVPTKTEQRDDDEELVRQRLEEEGVVIVDPNISPPGSNRPSAGGGDDWDNCEPSTSVKGTISLLRDKGRRLKKRNISSTREAFESRTASTRRKKKRKTISVPQNRVAFELAAIDEERITFGPVKKRLALQAREGVSGEIHDDPIMNRFLQQLLLACAPAGSGSSQSVDQSDREIGYGRDSSHKREEKEDSGVFSDSSTGHFQNSLASPPPSSSRPQACVDVSEQQPLDTNGLDELMGMRLHALAAQYAQYTTGPATASADQCDASSGNSLETGLLQAAMQVCTFLASGGTGGAIDHASLGLPTTAVCDYPVQIPPQLHTQLQQTAQPAVGAQQLALNWLFSTLLQQYSTVAPSVATGSTSSSAVTSTSNGCGSASAPGSTATNVAHAPAEAQRVSPPSPPTTTAVRAVDTNGRGSGVSGKKRKSTTTAESARHFSSSSSNVTVSAQQQQPSNRSHSSQQAAVARRPPSAPNKNTVKCLAQQGQAAIGDDVQLMDLEELEAFASNFKRQRIKHGFTQGDIGMALGKRYGTDFSQTTISRFEALNLSYKNMCKLRPLLKEWLEETEALLENGASVTDILEAPSATEKLELGATTGALPAQTQSADRETDEDSKGAVENNRHHVPQASPQLCRSLLIPHLKRRRKRTNLDNAQRAALDTFFQANPRPDHQRMIEISNELDLEADVVRVWFCNRRQKLRKVEEEEP